MIEEERSQRIALSLRGRLRPRVHLAFKSLLSIAGYDFLLTSEDAPIQIWYGDYEGDDASFKIVIPAYDAPHPISDLVVEEHRVPPPPNVSYLEGGCPFLYKYFTLREDGEVWLRYRNGGAAAVITSSNLIALGFDLAHSTWWFLSRMEERTESEDKHGRFPARESVAWREGFLDQAVVNRYSLILAKAIEDGFKRLNLPLVEKCRWPENRGFAACLTHDVDGLRWISARSLLKRALGYLKHGRLKKALNTLLHASLLKAGRIKTKLDMVLSLESRYGYASTFFFASSKCFGVEYSIDDAEARQALEKVKKLGKEVGLHGSYESFVNPYLLRHEKALLERTTKDRVYGVRQHFLRFKTPLTWRAQVQAGLIYDSTLGYADHVGLRASIAAPFHPLDEETSSELEILELPLGVMDMTLTKYMKLDWPKGIYEVMKLLSEVEKVGGLVVILWHGDAEPAEPLWSSAYAFILKYLSRRAAWVATCLDVAKWWLKREGLSVEAWIMKKEAYFKLKGEGWVRFHLPPGWRLDREADLLEIKGEEVVKAFKTG